MNEPTIGHNSMTKGVKEYLRGVVERIEIIETERKTLADDIKDIFTEAKSRGLDVKTIRKVLVQRRKDAQKREEEQALLDLYMDALGILG